MSALRRCQSYRGSNKESKEKKGSAGVCFTEVFVKRKSTVLGSFYFISTGKGKK